MPSDPTPRPNSTPPNKPRRRPGPGGGGNWLWMLILLALVGMFLVNNLDTKGPVEWGEFWALIKDDTTSKSVKKVTYRGANQFVVEVDPSQVPANLKDRLDRNNRFTVMRPPINEDRAIFDRLSELERRDKVEKDGKVVVEPLHV